MENGESWANVFEKIISVLFVVAKNTLIESKSIMEQAVHFYK